MDDLKVIDAKRGEAMASAQVRAPYYDYNRLAEAYNGAEVGALILLPLYGKRARVSNVTKVLLHRGIEANKGARDAEVFRLREDEDGKAIPVDERPLAVRKLSRKQMQFV